MIRQEVLTAVEDATNTRVRIQRDDPREPEFVLRVTGRWFFHIFKRGASGVVTSAGTFLYTSSISAGRSMQDVDAAEAQLLDIVRRAGV